MLGNKNGIGPTPVTAANATHWGLPKTRNRHVSLPLAASGTRMGQAKVTHMHVTHPNIVDGSEHNADGDEEEGELDGVGKGLAVKCGLNQRYVGRRKDFHHLVEADGVEGEGQV